MLPDLLNLEEEPRFLRQTLRFRPIYAAPRKGRFRGVSAPALLVVPRHWALTHMPATDYASKHRSQVTARPVFGASAWSIGGLLLTCDLSIQAGPWREDERVF